MKRAILIPVVLMAAAPAFAGGLTEPLPETPVAAPVVVEQPGLDWTGGWVGARLGYGDVSAGADDGNGMIYGLAAGYDWDFGQWVAGAGVDWEKADIDIGTGGDALDSITRLKLRAGADLGRTLVYATAGPAWADATVGGASQDDNGWFAGIGADYALTERWTVGGELLTNQFDDFGGTGTDLEATTATVNVGLRF